MGQWLVADGGCRQQQVATVGGGGGGSRRPWAEVKVKRESVDILIVYLVENDLDNT